MGTVLLIETRGPLMRLMAWFLLEAEYRVTVANTLDVARAHAAAGPDVIVFNTHMEPEPKRAAIAALRAHAPASRILDIRDQRTPSLETGADAYLELPFGSYELLTSVRELQGQRG